MRMRCSLLKKTVAFLLAASIVLSLFCAASAEIRIDAVILPESDHAVRAAVTVNNIALGLLFPFPDSTYYLLYWEDFPDILSQILDFDFSEINTDALDDQMLTSLALRYGKIIISVAGIFNFSRKKMNYELSAFHSAPQCVVWTCTPSRRDWSKMLTKLFATALSDGDLATLLPDNAFSLIQEGQDHISDLSEILDGLSFQAATDENNIYAVRISKNSESLCYQYPGVPSSEHAIVYEKDGNSSVLIYAKSELNSAAVTETPKRVSSADELTEIISFLFELLSSSVT